MEADGALIGTLGSFFENNGIAQIRLDRAAKALENGKTFNIGDIEIQLIKPQWAGYGEEFKSELE